MWSSSLIRCAVLTLIAGMVHSAVTRHKNKHGVRKTRSDDVHNKLTKLDDLMISEVKARIPNKKLYKRNKGMKGIVASHLSLPNDKYGIEEKNFKPKHFERLERKDNKQKKKDTAKHHTFEESKLAKDKKDAKLRNSQQKKQNQEPIRQKRSAVSSKRQTSSAKKKKPEVKEFPLEDIIFKGKASNEANKFIRGNTKVGKPLELVYEYTREQDLNDIEEKIQRRFIEFSNLKT